MSCQIGSSYTIKADDILFDIAERELGDGNRWREFVKPNGIPFTEEEANNLQVGQEICLPNGKTDSPQNGDWQSECVSYGSDGRLTYTSVEKNRIPDYSFAGYRYGEEDLPDVPEVASIKPVSGDNTEHIQKALDAVGARKPDAKGIRGALVLKPGVYEIRGTIHVNKSGVVLRGSGDGTNADKDTILVAKVVDKPIVDNRPEHKGRIPQNTVVILGTKDSTPWEQGSETKITDDFVQVGSLSFNVEDASLFKAGDRIIIRHPSTQKWIDALDRGGVVKEKPWQVDKVDIVYYRQAVEIIPSAKGSKIHLDAPIYNHLDRKLSQSSAFTVKSSNVLTHVGLENLRIDIEKGGEDKNGVWNAVGIIGAEDSWVRNITTLHFGLAGVFTEGALRVTVMDVKALDPIAVRTGGRMYNFNTEKHSQLILFQSCDARNGRHNFISNGTSSASGIVFHRCKSQGSFKSTSEGHRLWTQAMLFDNIDESSPGGEVMLFNRADMGSGHGWAAVHSTIWNYNGDMYVQKPPTAQNYAISSAGRLKPHPKNGHPGAVEHAEIKNGKLSPESLYEAQLRDRTAEQG
jgi:hypothetical protein